MASRRSKKKGIVVNHLASFEHAPGNSPPEGRGYNHYQRSYNQSSRYQSSKSSGSRYSKKEYVNTYRHKEQFLNANFRFVLSRQNEAIQPHYVDPDSPIEWDDLEQLCLYSVTDYECPICLERPVAGKITKCGHVFCWPCLLQFFSNAQGGFDRWKGCPCCAESISIDCIKTTLVHTTKSFVQGDQITFSLIQREKTSMVAMPRCKWNAKTAREFLDCESEDSVYSRLSTVRDKKSLIRREMVELSSYKDFQKIDSPYFDLALSKLSDQLTQLVIEENKAEMARQEQQTASKPSGPFIEIDGAKVELTENSTDWEQDQSVVEKEAPASVPRPAQNEVFYSVGDAVTIQRPDLFHFYYQEMGGQQIFLDHIAIRALFAQYGSALSLPDKITATVLEIKESTVDDRLKRRIKYLDHLPTKATVYFCEIDLEHSGIVTRETLHPFLKEIRQNASKRESDLRSSQKQNESLPLFEYDPLNPPVPLPVMPEVDLSNITPELFPTLKSSLSDSQLSADESEALSLSYARALNASFVDLDDEFENPPLGFNSAAFPPLSGAWSGSSSSSSSSSSPASASAPSSSLSTSSPEPTKPASPAKKGRGKKGGRTVISLSSLHKN